MHPKHLLPFITLGLSAPTLSPRDIPPSFLQTLTLYAQYSAAAYCPDNSNSPGTKLTCSAGNCPLVENADTNTLSEFEDPDRTGDVAGYLAVDKSNKKLILAFRGTRSIETWVANVQMGKEDAGEICAGCEVHSGFWKSWSAISEATLDAVRKAVEAHPGYGIVVTGHSFGGALATIAAAVLRNLKIGGSVDMYDYGAPRIGNSEFAEYVSAQGANYRVTHANDIVPRLPPKMFGFHQLSPEYWVHAGNGEAVGTGDVVMIDEADSKMGNRGADMPGVEAHKWYLGKIDACR
ncbi:Alpha/Beta hydrolase protein [Aspergillus avenaceus]|uniref:feruloyl esterase n=1 Tax=Aspergillus avenaceus TaxID=36643 RepID=A0A5N6TTH7_ASPAV|nr:Alpha/Beta hydrolase protein [Aspergillus avenaceus]